MPNENYPKKYYKDTLLMLDRSCEVCHDHMHDHEWAILDINGFALYCSNSNDNGN